MRPMTYTVDISDPLTLAETCLAAADAHAQEAAEHRHAEQHSAAGVEREHQRYYTKRAEVLAAVSTARSMERIADALDRIALAQ
jgi:hypothetical protein